MGHLQNIQKLAGSAGGDLTVRVYMDLFGALSLCSLLQNAELAAIADCLDAVSHGEDAATRAAALHLIAAVNAYKD